MDKMMSGYVDDGWTMHGYTDEQVCRWTDGEEDRSCIDGYRFMKKCGGGKYGKMNEKLYGRAVGYMEGQQHGWTCGP